VVVVEGEEVVVVEGDGVPGLEADHMTVGGVHPQGADQGLKIPGLEADQDMADVPEIVLNMDLVQNLALTLLPSLMEMDAQRIPGPGQGLGRIPGPGQGPRIEIKS